LTPTEVDMAGGRPMAAGAGGRRECSGSSGVRWLGVEGVRLAARRKISRAIYSNVRYRR